MEKTYTKAEVLDIIGEDVLFDEEQFQLTLKECEAEETDEVAVEAEKDIKRTIIQINHTKQEMRDKLK